MQLDHVRLDHKNDREIFHTLEKMYHLWGYTLASIPLFDEADTYRDLLTKKEYEKTVRCIHGDGRILLLRSDITLFLLKFITSQVVHKSLPLRLSYLDEIVGVYDQNGMYENETIQSGVELIGLGGIEGDAEIILLLQESLTVLSKEPICIHIGSCPVVKAIAHCYACDYSLLLEAVRARNKTRCTSLLEGIPERSLDALMQLLFFIGSLETFDSLVTKLHRACHQEVLDECEYLIKVCTMVQSCGYDLEMRIDISELGRHTYYYYSGIVFSVYQQGVAYPLAYGGRYDDLLSELSHCHTTAIGFSLFPLKLSYNLQKKTSAKRIESGTFEERFQKARELRSRGKAAVL